MRADSRRHLHRAGLHLTLALRYLWWFFWGSPYARSEEDRRYQKDHITLERIRRQEEYDARKRAARETLVFERLVKDHRRKGWVSIVKEERKVGRG